MNTELVGVIPEDDAISLALNLDGAVNKTNSSFEAFNIIAKNIHYGEHNYYDCTKKYKGIVGNLRKKIRRFV